MTDTRGRTRQRRDRIIAYGGHDRDEYHPEPWQRGLDEQSSRSS
jgi:hypothetical protein